MKKMIKYSVVPFLLIVIFIFFYDFPKKIEVTRPAVSFNEKDPTSLKDTFIHVSGSLSRPLFRNHVFEGSIIIDGIEKTVKYETMDIEVLKNNNEVNMGNLVYNTSSTYATMLGIIWFDDNFYDISILGVNTEDKQKEIVYIVTGESYEEALSTLKKMKNKYGSGFINFE